MTKRFFLGWFAVYALSSITGYLEHDIILADTYRQLMSVLHSSDIRSKIWAFVVTSITGSFFFTLIFSKWQKKQSILEGLEYGLIIGTWIGLFMSLNTYASTGLIPFSLAIQWFIYNVIQYAAAGSLLAYCYRFKSSLQH